MAVASLLLLADARFPDGSHAHSFGLEAAVADGRVASTTELTEYIEARLWSTARTEAGAALLAARGTEPLADIDAALSLRTPGAAARRTSRALGRSLVRTASRLWPDQPIPSVDCLPPMQPVALGAVASLAGCSPAEAALCITHSVAGTLATAALRLLGLDPFSVSAVLVDLRRHVTDAAASVEHLEHASDLPHRSTPLAELDPELQALLEPRLFGS